MPGQDLRVEISKLEPKAGEILVVKTARVLTEDQRARLAAHLETIAPGTPCLIVDQSIEVEAVLINGAVLDQVKVMIAEEITAYDKRSAPGRAFGF